ncbi:MAG TPA: glycine cleavage system protein GcvH [Candidatus Limnocylindria bacterium]|nr:glycine cleavage system protein GcvH [Candidatus Limnocylindria bacterium]
MNIPGELRYTKDHEWLRVEGDIGEVGITDFAQDSLGDVVFVELPAVGARLTRGATFGVVESNKSVSDLFAPVSGEVVAVNDRLAEQPELVNQSPYQDGWMIRVRIGKAGELGELLDAAAYEAHVASEHHG